MEISQASRLLAVTLGALPGLFLLVTSTTYLVEGQFVYDVKRLLQLCLMLLLFLAAALNGPLRHAFALQLARIPRWVKALLGLIILLGIASSAVNATSAMHLAYSLLEVALLSMLVLAALVIAACRAVGGELFDQVAITLLALTAIAVGTQELVGVASALSSGLEFHSHISLMHFSFPRFYNQVQGWTLPIIAALPFIWARSNSQLLRTGWFAAITCLLALALHWYVILMSGGRGVAVGLAVSFAACLVIFPAIRRNTLLCHLPGLLIGIALFLGVAEIHELILEDSSTETQSQTIEPQSDDGGQILEATAKEAEKSSFAGRSLAGRLNFDSTGRWWLWRQSLNDIVTHPAIGIGPMNYACAGPVHRAAHPHNFALQFAGEWGIPALLALIILIGYAVLNAFLSIRQPQLLREVPIIGGFLVMGLVAAGTHAFFSGVLVMPASQVAGVLAVGWLTGMVQPNEHTESMKSPRTLELILAGLFVCAICTAFSFSETRQREYREKIIPSIDQLLPRYWQQGKLCKYFDQY